MDSDARYVGQFLGIIVNIFVQFTVWRYLVVYYSLSGDKGKYLDKKVAYNFLFVLLGLISYPILWMAGVFFWPIAVVILIAFIYFAITFSSKWSSNNILPDPFGSPKRPSQAKSQTRQPSPVNLQQSQTTSVPEDAFFTILRLDGVAKARSIYQQAIQRDPNAVVFQESQMNKLAYEELKKGNVNFATDLLKLNLEAFPNSTNCYASLADALKAAGNTEEAITYYKKALEVLVVDRSNTQQFRESLLADIKSNLSKLNVRS